MSPDDLAKIHASAFTQERPWTSAEIAALVAAPHTHLTIDTDGFALWRAVADEAELLTIAVLAAAQGRGIGAKLMQSWMSQAQKKAQTAFLDVAADNHAARALYAKFGFECVALRKNYYQRTGPKADALTLRASLPVSVP